MAYESRVQRYTHWYALLLSLYPRPYRQRFGASMQQTFGDLCRERVEARQGLAGFALWTFAETFVEILKEEVRFSMESKSILRVALGTLVVLMIPAAIMQFSSEMNWGLEDFVAIGVLVFGAGLVYEFIAARVQPKQRLYVGLVVLAGVLVVWAELAVDAVSKGLRLIFG